MLRNNILKEIVLAPLEQMNKCSFVVLTLK